MLEKSLIKNPHVEEEEVCLPEWVALEAFSVKHVVREEAAVVFQEQEVGGHRMGLSLWVEEGEEGSNGGRSLNDCVEGVEVDGVSPIQRDLPW